MTELVIYGAGAVGRLTAQIVQDINRQNETWLLRGFLDDAAKGNHQNFHDLPILGDRSWLKHHSSVSVAVAIGASATRWKVVQELRLLGHEKFPTLVHPRAWIGDRTVLGGGVLIYPGTMIDPDVEIRSHAVINKLCTVGHDTVIGDFVTLAPAVHVTAYGVLRTGCNLGTACCTLNHVTVGQWSFVGAGSVVTKSIPDNVAVVGVPARVIKRQEPGWHQHWADSAPDVERP